MALAALLAVALPATAETPSEKADALLAGLIKTNDPGLAVLVAQDGKILFEKGYGLADRKHHVPITPQTIFCIGSITKQFTASAILKLQEGGKLSVTNKLSKYIPVFARGDEVTLRELLNHTSGIHDDSGSWNLVANDSTEAVTDAMKKATYDFDPGTKWSYDNSGYVLLGYIVEKVSGQSYGDFLRENFFQPLGMTNTGVCRANFDLPHEALGYDLETNGFEPALNTNPSSFGGAGALYSTVEDLYRWNEGIFNGRVLDAVSLQTAFTPVKMDENQDTNSSSGYGFGWMIRNYYGMQEIWHNGGVSGFESCLIRLPDAKLTVAVLANSYPGNPNDDPDRAARRLVKIFLAGKFAPLPLVNTRVSPKSYDALTGRYEIMGAIMVISRRGAHLFGQLAAQPESKAEIFPESATNFFTKLDSRFAFVKDSSGKAVKLIVHTYDGIEADASRAKDIAEAKVDPAVYDNLVGQYDYGNGVVLTVTRKGNHLFAQLTGQPMFEIFPESETTYFWKVMDAQVTFVKDATGKVTRAIHHHNGHTIDAPKIQ